MKRQLHISTGNPDNVGGVLHGYSLEVRPCLTLTGRPCLMDDKYSLSSRTAIRSLVKKEQKHDVNRERCLKQQTLYSAIATETHVAAWRPYKSLHPRNDTTHASCCKLDYLLDPKTALVLICSAGVRDWQCFRSNTSQITKFTQICKIRRCPLQHLLERVQREHIPNGDLGVVMMCELKDHGYA